MPPVGFQPTISAGGQPQTYALDGAATGIGILLFYKFKNEGFPFLYPLRLSCQNILTNETYLFDSIPFLYLLSVAFQSVLNFKSRSRSCHFTVVSTFSFVTTKWHTFVRFCLQGLKHFSCVILFISLSVILYVNSARYKARHVCRR